MRAAAATVRLRNSNGEHDAVRKWKKRDDHANYKEGRGEKKNDDATV